jgi:hypothetical protein
MRSSLRSFLLSTVQAALARLKGKVRYRPLGFGLLPPRFTLTQLQRVYEDPRAPSRQSGTSGKKLLAMGSPMPTFASTKDGEGESESQLPVGKDGLFVAARRAVAAAVAALRMT